MAKGRTALTVVAVAALLGAATTAPAQGRCTTQWHPTWRQWETKCSDGSTATEKYNPTWKQWESVTRTPSNGTQSTQQCVKKYNPTWNQWETVCR